MARSGKDSSVKQSRGSLADEDFYNPMPMKNFSKNYQPSLAFSGIGRNYQMTVASDQLPSN